MFSIKEVQSNIPIHPLGDPAGPVAPCFLPLLQIYAISVGAALTKSNPNGLFVRGLFLSRPPSLCVNVSELTGRGSVTATKNTALFIVGLFVALVGRPRGRGLPVTSDW